MRWKLPGWFFVALGALIMACAFATADAGPAPTSMAEHTDVLWAGLVGALTVVQWLGRSYLKRIDAKLSRFGEELYQPETGLCHRVAILEHDYSKCCGGSNGHPLRRKGEPDYREE